MSLSSTVNRNDYLGNGAVKTYPYTFKIFQADHLRAIVTDDSSPPVETTLTKDVDYSITGVGDAAGGSITLINAGQAWLDGDGDLEVDYKLTLRRVVELKQETDVRNQGDFFPEVHEDQMDLHTMADQQQQDELDRCVKNPESVPTSDFDPTLPTDIATANRALITNSAGTGLALGLTAVDNERIFNGVSQTYAELKVISAADPTSQRWGWATDLKQLFFYCGEVGIGDQGWILVA